jgi:hypothetical protein
MCKTRAQKLLAMQQFAESWARAALQPSNTCLIITGNAHPLWLRFPRTHTHGVTGALKQHFGSNTSVNESQ